MNPGAIRQCTRALPLCHGAGFDTALVDASSDRRGEDGLAGFRVTAKHAEDLGKVIADVRVLTSALMSGYAGGRKPWVAHTEFDLPLEAIRMPVLVVGHGEDKCVRSPPDLMGNIPRRPAAHANRS